MYNNFKCCELLLCNNKNFVTHFHPEINFFFSNCQKGGGKWILIPPTDPTEIVFQLGNHLYIT